jgi:hypothetical protein
MFPLLLLDTCSCMMLMLILLDPLPIVLASYLRTFCFPLRRVHRPCLTSSVHSFLPHLPLDPSLLPSVVLVLILLLSFWEVASFMEMMILVTLIDSHVRSCWRQGTVGRDIVY